MGTTQDAIRDADGKVELAYVLCIEGYPYLLTDGIPAKAVTAWAGTSWSQALPGLQVSGTFKQDLKPWSNEVHVPHFRFSVLPEETDQFGIDMFRAKPAIRSELTAGFGTGDSGGGGFNISVKDAGLFSTAPVFIGNEAFNVTSAPSGTTVPVATNGSGFMAPFGTDSGSANTFPGPHTLPAGEVVGAYESTTPVYVSDAPPTWIGKKVGLWVHQVVNGVLDTKAEAELWFAGTISRVSESDLMTVVDCDGIQQALVDAQLMSNQWTGRITNGYQFKPGEGVRAIYSYSGNANSAWLYAVASSPGADEFLAGTYTVEEFGSIIAEHADADGTCGVSGSVVQMRWTAAVISTNDGPRFSLQAKGTSNTARVGIQATSASILEFLGFTSWYEAATGPNVASPTQESTDILLVSDRSPLVSPSMLSASGNVTLQIEESSGDFVDHTSMLPAHAREHVTGAEVWSYYIVGGKSLILGRRDSATEISGITVATSISGLTNTGLVDVLNAQKDNEPIIVKQVLFITGTLCDITAKLFASIDGNGENHATYDVLPFGAGIPWELLGQNFLDSLGSLEQAGVEDSIAVIIEKPTRLWDALRSDFSLRMAAPVWKDGGLQFAQLTVPNASTSDFTLTEANKSNTDRTTAVQTSDFLAHTVKFEINRNPITDKYQDSIIARDKVAYENAGGSGATKTIKARNTYSGGVNSGSSAEALADMITARFLPVFSRELRTWRRSIPHTMFHMTPGDTVTFSDDFARDPATGQRGVSSRPAIVLGVQHSLGISSGGQGYSGIVDLLYTEEDRLFPLAPSCEHATVTATATGRNWTSGYDDEVGTAGVFSLLVHPNEFSDTTEANDHTHFTAGDAIRITEIDPADPAGADSFRDVVVSTAEGVSTTYDEIVLTTGFGNSGNPAFDAAKTYLVNFDAYNQCAGDQLLHAFQADDADGQILDTAEPNLVADSIKYTPGAADITELPARHSVEQFGDGEPLSASFVRDQIRKANNLTNFKTAPHTPMHLHSDFTCNTSGADDFLHIWTLPYLIGNENWAGSLARVLNIAPMFASVTGVTVKVNVHSSANPPAGTSAGGFKNVEFHGPSKKLTFSTTSTTFQVSTSQQLEVVRAEGMPEFTWITIEGDNLCDFRALAELYLGPMQ